MIRPQLAISALTIAVLTILTTALPVSAQGDGQSGNGFRISPVRSELTIEKGKSQTSTISLENPTSLPITASAIVNDFVASDSEDGKPRLILDSSDSPRHSFKKLVGTIPNIQLGPKEKKDIKIVINVPADAAAGGYYGAIRFAPATTDNSSTLGISASVGSIYLISVPGNLREHLTLKQFSAASNGVARSFITSGKVSIITRLQNTGDIHEKPFGKIVIKNMSGKIVEQQEMNPPEIAANILPDSIRKFDTQLKNKKWIGRYTASVSLSYANGNGELLNAKTAFWYIPTWLAFVIAGIVLLILGGAYVVFNRFTRHHRHGKAGHR